jgi:TolA-binding protein
MRHICDGRDLMCTGCAASAKRHQLVRAAMTADDHLDDIRRAQIWTRLEDALSGPVKRRWGMPAVIGIAACATVAIAVLVRPHRDESLRALDAPPDTSLSAQLGPHTRAELVGPARLELVGVPGEATSVRLRSGTLLAEFSGGAGRSLHVEAPGAAVDIVGTLFAVEVHASGTCVSVSHGKVRVTTATRELAVETGETWCTQLPAPHAVTPAMRSRFDRFAAVLTATTDRTAPLDATAPIIDDPPRGLPRGITVTPIDVPPAMDRGVTSPPAPLVAHAEHRDAVAVKPAPVVHAEHRDAIAVGPAPVVPDQGRDATTVEPAPTSVPTFVATPSATAEPPSVPAAPSAPPVKPAVTPPPPEPAAALYQAAETALAARDLTKADRLLGRVVAEYPSSPLVDQALYERARIAYQHHAWSDAQRHLDKLAEVKSTPLAEPGAYLACRIAVEAHDGAAERCLVDYRRVYPSSPHDRDVLGLLIELEFRSGGCERARAVIEELVRKYPDAALASAWRSRCKESR